MEEFRIVLADACKIVKESSRKRVISGADEDGRVMVEFSEPVGGRRVKMLTPDEINGMLYKEETSESPANAEEAMAEETEPPTAGQEESGESALERIPKDAQTGEPQYTQTDADTAWDALVEQCGGDADMAQGVADSMVKDMETALKKAEKSAPAHGVTVAEKIAAAKGHKAAVEKARTELEKWRAIAGETASRARAAEEAERRRKKERLDAAREELRRNGRYAKEDAALGDYTDFADYAMRTIATGKYRFLWGDRESGTQGLGAHLGFTGSRTERNKRIWLLSKDGFTPEEAAERMLADYSAAAGFDSVGDTGVDSMEALDVILDVLRRYTSPRAMMDDAKAAHAENGESAEERRQGEEYERGQFMEAYHMTPEEYYEYENEWLPRYMEEAAQVPQEVIDNINAEYAEKYSENGKDDYNGGEDGRGVPPVQGERLDKPGGDEGGGDTGGAAGAVGEGDAAGGFVPQGASGREVRAGEVPQPVGKGAFGDIYDQFRGDAKAAFDFLTKHRSGDLLGVFHRDDTGDIDLVWGDENSGLSHILTKHVGKGKDFGTEQAAFDKIESILKNGKLIQDGRLRYVVSEDGYRVAIRKDYDGVKKNWIVTAVDYNRSKEEKEITTNPTSASHGANGPELAAPNNSKGKVTEESADLQENGGKDAGGKAEMPLSEQIDAASAEVNTEPTEAQKEAGNYKKGHVQVGAFDITIEQPEGSIRRGTDADGKQWESKMHNTYGYFRGTEGVDGDHIDVFLSNDMDGWNGRKVYVVDQYNPDGTFDEHKVMLGFNDMDEAKGDYLANYGKGWENGRRIDVSAVNLEDFEKWIASSHRKTKPFSEYKSVKPADGNETFKGHKVENSGKDIEAQIKHLEEIKDYPGADKKIVQSEIDRLKAKEEAKAKSKNVQGTNKTGAFGTIYTQFKGKAKEAIAFLLEKKEGEAVGALHHKDIGDIDLVWGKEGTGKSDGFGLAKLVKYHPEVLDDLQEILDDMTVVKKNANRVQLESKTHKASVRLAWDKEKKNWLLTAYEKKNSASDNTTDTAETAMSGKRNDTATPQNTVSMGKVSESPETKQEKKEKSEESKSKEETGNTVLYHRGEVVSEMSQEERVLRDAVIDRLRESGMEVITDEEAGQRVLDEANGKAKLSAKKRRALETASLGKTPRSLTVVSSADGANVLKSIDSLVSEFEKSAVQPKTFIGDVAKALGAKRGGSASEYASFETKNGKIITIRLSNHNAKVSNFDANGETDGISIVVSPKKSEGMTNDGKAHVVEYYYDAIKLRRAEGKPLADIVRSIKQALYSGEFEDTTGLAERQEVNAEITDRVRFFRTAKGEAYGFTVGGKIYIDPKIANTETPIHEYAHLWAAALRGQNPKEWQNIVELMKGTSVWDEVKKRYPELNTDDDIADEVLATYSGRRGAERLREEQRKIAGDKGGVFEKAEAISALERVKQALRKFWKSVADFLHIHYKSAEEVADRVMKDLLDGVDPGKHFNSRNDDPRFMFVGEKGAARADRGEEALTRQNNLGAAQKMEAAKKEAKAIKLATGWERGADGKWRYETGDASLWDGLRLTKRGTEERTTLGEMLEDSREKEELLAAYPQLKAMPLVFKDMGYGEFGHYDGKEIVLNSYLLTDDSGRFTENASSVLAHEIQHAIQHIEGFATGGNLKAAMEYLSGNKRADVKIKQQLAYKLSQEKGLGLSEEEVNSLIGHLEYEDISDDELQKQIDALCQKHNITEDQLEDIYPMDSVWHEAYNRISGEAEARNVQKRMGMTAEERRASLAADTEDVARDSQILLFDDTGKSLSLESPKEDDINAKFNIRLAELVKNPDQKDKVLHLGRSSKFLTDGGLADAEIILEFDKLAHKSKEGYKHEHPFDISDIKDLPKAISSPIAVFDNTNDKNDGRVILTELKKDGRNFIVAVKTSAQNRRGGIVLEVNQITTLFPKDAKGIVYWFNSGKATNIDKEKALRFIEALPNHPGTTIKEEELFSAAKVVKDFVNPKFESENEALFRDGKELRDGRKIEFVKKPTATYNALARHLQAEGIKPDMHEARTGSRYMSFEKDGVQWEVRSSDHTKPEYYGEAQKPVELTYYKDKQGEENLSVSVDLGTSGYNIEDMKALMAEIDRLKNDAGEVKESFDRGVASNEVVECYPLLSQALGVKSENEVRAKEEARKHAEEARKQEMRSAVEDMAGKLHLNNVDIVDKPAERGAGRRERAKGMFERSTGRITINTGNCADKRDAVVTLLHEAVAHHGLRKLFGENFETFLDNVYNSANAEIRRIIDKHSSRYGGDKRTATEEYMASLAERTDFENAKKSGWWQRIKDFFLKMLEKIGLKGFKGEDLSDNELRYVLWRSYENLKSGGKDTVFSAADDLAKQSELKVGEFAPDTKAEGSVAALNTRFNNELQQQIDGNLPSSHIYQMGKPGQILRSTGVPDLPIQMNAKRLQDKATLFDHNFELYEVKDLVKALQNPLAVFSYGDKTKAQNIIVPLQKDGKNFIVGLSLNPTVGGKALEINSIRNVFPKDNSEWLNWISQGKALYLDKEKIQTLIAQQRTNLADVEYLDLDSAAKIVENFENPKSESENDALFRDGDAKDYEKAQARDRYERRVSTGMFQSREAIQDSMLSLKVAMDAIEEATAGKAKRIEDYDGFENAYLGENRLSSVNQAESTAFAHLLIRPMMEEVNRLAPTAEDRAELIDYMFAKHGLERNAYMRQQAAEKKLAEYKKQNPGTAKTAADFIDAERDYAGLTALTGEADVSAAEAEAQRMVADYEKDYTFHGTWNEIYVCRKKIC